MDPRTDSVITPPALKRSRDTISISSDEDENPNPVPRKKVRLFWHCMQILKNINHRLSIHQIILEFGPKPVKAEVKVENKLLKVSIMSPISCTLKYPLMHIASKACCR